MRAKQFFTKKNRVTLIHNGQPFIDTCCRMVREAREKILFHTYAFKADDVTQPFVDALVQRATEGVQVFIIIDAIGSPEIPSALKQRFHHPNIHFRYFAPLISKHLENVGRRLHQKLLLIDNTQALVGGINHTQHFIKPATQNPWLDYALLLEGEEVYRLQKQVKKLYQKCFPAQIDLLNSLISPNPSPPDDCHFVRTNVNDFAHFKSEIYRSYLFAIRRAKRSVCLFAPYFLPGKRLLRELKRAVQRGVSVELVFSAHSDHPTERWSSKYLYPWYLKQNIAVYEWDLSIVHGKLALIDDEWVTLGSYNHNFLSRYSSLELNLEVISKPFAREVHQEVNNVKRRSKRITEEDWLAHTSKVRSFLYLFSYSMASLLSFLSVLMIARKKHPEQE